MIQYQYYCANRDILLDYDEFSNCRICGDSISNCKTVIILQNTRNNHKKLVNQYLRKQKLKRILDENLL
jgi:hypothetical protein